MLWIGQSYSTPDFLRSRLTFAIVVGSAATVLFTWILFQMERSNANYKAAVMEAQLGDRDTQLELEEESMGEEKKYDDNSNDYVQAGTEAEFACSSTSTSASASSPQNNNNNNASGNGYAADSTFFKPGDSRRRLLTRSQQIMIVMHVSVLILLNYLLLVFLPGSALLSFVAMTAIWILTLHSYLRDELQRRERWDRLGTMVALFFVIAGCLTLLTYCRLALREGSVYQGPARIVGYDMGLYDNSDEETLRTDLQVSWGGAWGCPDNGDRVCTATVQGALCETDYSAEDYAVGGDDTGGRRRRRRRALKKSVNSTQTEAAAAGDQEEFTDAEKDAMAEKEKQDEEAYDEKVDEVVVEDEEVIEEEADEEVDAYEEEVYVEAEDEVEEYEDELDEDYEDEVEGVEEEKAFVEEEVEEVDVSMHTWIRTTCFMIRTVEFQKENVAASKFPVATEIVQSCCSTMSSPNRSCCS